MIRYLLISLVLFFATIGYADDYRLKLERNPIRAIPSLVWNPDADTQNPKIQSGKNAKNEVIYFVTLRGRYTGNMQGRSLLTSSGKMIPSPRGEVSLNVVVQTDLTEVSITEIDEHGTVSLQKDRLLFPEWDEFKKLQKRRPKKWSVSPGMGLSAIDVNQTGITRFVELALTAKLAGQLKLWGPWDLEGAAYYSGLTFNTNSSGAALTFLGAALRTGFHLLKHDSNWDLFLSAGFYYATTYANGTFGYQDLMGPQVFSSLSRTLPQLRSIWLYVKYSPILSGFQLISLDNGDIGMGAGYSFPIFNRHVNLGIAFDCSLLTLKYAGGSITTNTYTLGITAGL
jgi:hypothetical protein